MASVTSQADQTVNSSQLPQDSQAFHAPAGGSVANLQQQTFPSYPRAHDIWSTTLQELKSIQNWISVLSLVAAVVFGAQAWNGQSSQKLQTWQNCMQFSSIQNTATCREAFEKQWGGVPMYQSEQLSLTFYRSDSGLPLDTRLSPLIFRGSLASLADFGSHTNITRIARCSKEPMQGSEFVLNLPVPEVHNERYQPLSATSQVSARPAYGEIDCRGHISLFALRHFCTHYQIERRAQSQFVRSSIPSSFFENWVDAAQGQHRNCFEQAGAWVKSYNDKYPKYADYSDIDYLKPVCSSPDNMCSNHLMELTLHVYQ